MGELKKSLSFMSEKFSKLVKKQVNHMGYARTTAGDHEGKDAAPEEILYSNKFLNSWPVKIIHLESQQISTCYTFLGKDNKTHDCCPIC